MARFVIMGYRQNIFIKMQNVPSEKVSYIKKLEEEERTGIAKTAQ